MNTREYFLPQSVNEATQLLAKHGPFMLVMAGGTIAMPLINDGISFPQKVMGLRRAGLSYVTKPNGKITIGAMSTLTQMLDLKEIPILQEAAHQVGGWAIRNMGTVGGNLFAPPPAGDFAAALMALDAQLKLVSTAGARIISLTDFYTGFMTTALSPGELVTEIQVPVPTGKTAYLKYGRKHANTPAVVTVAAQIELDGEGVTNSRIALNAVGPHPIRASKAEEILSGSPLNPTTINMAASAAAEECEPFSDAIATEWYRRKMVEVYVRRTLTKITDRR
ncbi:MAG: FAD binding domain-containing protein [Anaerolineales bacterium]|nr:FAD binding domain-containing protein [Anaerolineales bacterium]